MSGAPARQREPGPAWNQYATFDDFETDGAELQDVYSADEDDPLVVDTPDDEETGRESEP
jgi:hypothetical protein